MNWLREHYERVLMIVAVVSAVASAIFICRGEIRLHWQLSKLPATPTLKDVSLTSKANDLSMAGQQLRQPPQWTFEGPSGLFVPERHFIGVNGLPAALQTTDVHPPVTNGWLDQFGLPIADADVLEQDPDNDGFNNFDEWVAHTDPNDADSHPDYITKLRLKSVTEEPCRLVFSSWVADTFAINTLDLKQPTQFVKVGDSIKGMRFKVVKFVEKYELNRYGTKIDVSELTLEQEATHQQLALVKERVATSPESVATFFYTWGGQQEFQVRNDQEFSLKPQEQIKYKLINVGPTKVLIVNSKRSDESIEIALFSP